MKFIYFILISSGVIDLKITRRNVCTCNEIKKVNMVFYMVNWMEFDFLTVDLSSWQFSSSVAQQLSVQHKIGPTIIWCINGLEPVKINLTRSTLIFMAKLKSLVISRRYLQWVPNEAHRLHEISFYSSWKTMFKENFKVEWSSILVVLIQQSHTQSKL